MALDRWPVADREVKPWWFHALNWGSVAFMLFGVLLLVAAAVVAR